MACGGAGNFCRSTELFDSVDVRFFDRMGAMLRKTSMSLKLNFKAKKQHGARSQIAMGKMRFPIVMRLGIVPRF